MRESCKKHRVFRLFGLLLLVAGGLPSGALAAGPETTAWPDGQLADLGVQAGKAVSEAPTFFCSTTTTGLAYCVYTGPIWRLYVNVYGTILLYPDPAITPALIQSQVEASGYEAYWGQDVSMFYAFAVGIPAAAIESTDPDRFHRESVFADDFYAMALAAQLSGRNVILQMRGTHGGNIEVDRIWVE